MKCALISANQIFYHKHNFPKLIEYIGGDNTYGKPFYGFLDFTDGSLEQTLSSYWILDEVVILKKVIADTRLNRTLYPEAKELDGYLILDESLKAEDFWGSK
jgi:hypothetical protein